jgi:protein ImuB
MTHPSKAPRRIAALWFPRLATDRLQRRDVTQSDAPLVVVTKQDNALRLTALDRKASKLGLSLGQPLANARAMLPELKVVHADAPADMKLLNNIADWCDRFTPNVAIDGPRCLLLDVTGASHLFGGEQAMLDTIRERLRAQGFKLRGAIAGTALAARALARYKDGAVIAQGAEAEAMGPLPIAALNLASEINHAFRRAGLKTIKQVAARKRSELTARFGAEIIATLDLALGHAQKPITPRQPIPDYWQEQNFPEPIATTNVIRATIVSLGQSLARIMELRGEGARGFEATFFRADGKLRRMAISLGAATRDARIIDRLFSEKLDGLIDPLDPGFGFDLIRLAATSVERMNADMVALDSNANQRAELNFLIDRLAIRFGANRILTFQPNDTHIPEAEAISTPAQYAKPVSLIWQKCRNIDHAPRRPLRLFTRPEPVNLIALPHLRWRKALHVVKHYEGPERIAMEWWRHETPQPTRDYFRIEDRDGRRYWLYQNQTSSQWFMHGVFA